MLASGSGEPCARELLLSEKVTSLEAFGMMEREFIAGWMRGVLLLLDHVDRVSRLKEIRRRLLEAGDRFLAVSLAVEVLEADGVVHMAESALLQQLLAALGVPPAKLPMIIGKIRAKAGAKTVMV